MTKSFTSIVNLSPGGSTISVTHKGKQYQAVETHPYWDQILQGVLGDDESIVELFDVNKALGARLALSERVSYAKGHLFFDGDEVKGGLVDPIVALISDGNTNITPWIKCMENIAQNPNPGVAKQIGEYIRQHGVTLTQDGRLVLYKYVMTAGKSKSDKPYRSGRQGVGIVNGVYTANDYVYQGLGDVVEMPRKEVTHDPNVECASGLHTGAWSYVSGSGDVILEVHVHPRDVGSIPTGSGWKIRVSKYKVVREVTEPYTEAVLPEEFSGDLSGQTSDARDSLGISTKSPERPEDGSESPQKVKHPGKASFKTMKMRAASKKKGFKRYAEGPGKWRYLGGDVDDRKSWSTV